MAKTLAQKIEAAKLRKEQEENLIANLLKQQKEEECKARNHRLCKRGGIVEKLLPDLAKLDDKQFNTFVEKVLQTRHTARVLAELLSPEPETLAATENNSGTVTS